ncbi:MAG TPA: phosphatidylinositol mannoside acyltransferase [Acidimicrobiia bacterium]|nr:phosphatidylinositol mannoside acyltransferase [Acidimicrobiia bacterium]
MNGLRSRLKGLPAYLAVRLFVGLFGLLPEPVMRGAGRMMGLIGSYVSPAKRRMVERHQRRVQGDHIDATKAARRVMASYGRYWAEVFWIRPRRRDGILRRSILERADRLHEAMDSGRGIVLAVCHTGNWEAAGLRAAAEGSRVLAVAENLGNRRITEWFVGLRSTMEMDVVLTGGGSRVTAELIRRLKEGGTIALLSDRDLSGRGVPVTFFGEETTLPGGPVALADRTGATLLPVGVYFREGHRGGHRFVVHPPLEIPAGGTAEERVALGTQRLAEALEEVIRERPEQWHVIVPNWPSDRIASA